MWKANGKTTTLVLFLDSLVPKKRGNVRYKGSSESDSSETEEAMDLEIAQSV
jgi:hypothetical protein